MTRLLHVWAIIIVAILAIAIVSGKGKTHTRASNPVIFFRLHTWTGTRTIGVAVFGVATTAVDAVFAVTTTTIASASTSATFPAGMRTLVLAP